MTTIHAISMIIVWAALHGVVTCQADDGPLLKVTLLDHVQISDDVLRIKHVAKLKGPPKAILKQWEELDLSDVSSSSGFETRITRSLITARLLLAGCPMDMITFDGATVVEVNQTEPLTPTDTEVERIAQQQLARQLGLDPQRVEVRLLGPCVTRLMPTERDTPRGQLDVILPWPLTNDPRITVRRIEGGVVKGTQSCGIRIRVARDWPILGRNLAGGQVVSASDVVTQLVWCHWTETPPQSDEYVGKRLKGNLQAESKLTLSDLTMPGPAPNQPQLAPVIKPRELIRVTALKGNLSVVLPSAEALQSGRPGERIRLRNLESQRVITGTVVAAGEVEIQLQ